MTERVIIPMKMQIKLGVLKSYTCVTLRTLTETVPSTTRAGDEIERGVPNNIGGGDSDTY